MENLGETKKSKILKTIKIASLGILGVTSSVAMAGYAERFLVSGDFGAAWFALLFAALFLVATALEAFLVKRVSVLFLLVLLQAVSPLALFTEKLKAPEGGGALLVLSAAFLLIFQIIGMKEGRATLENSLKIKALQTAKATIPKITTGLILFTSILLYLSYFIWGGWNDTMGKRLSDGVWEGAEPVLKVWIEGARADQTVDEFLRAATEAEIRKLKTKAAKERAAEFDFDLLTPEEREKRVGEIVEKMKGEIKRIAGPFEGSEKIKDVLYRTLKKQAEGAGLGSKELRGPLGIVLTLIVFGLLKSLAFLISWVAELGAVMALKLLLAAGFAEVSFESASREKIEL